MNLKWLKQHVLIVGSAAAFLIVLGGVVWLQQSASSKRSEVDGALDEQKSQLDHLMKQKPGPSRENIELLKKERESLGKLYDQLVTTVGRSRIPVQTDLQALNFLQQMASEVSRLRQAAETNNVKLAEGFAFGFGRYGGSSPQLPARGLPEEESKRVLTLLVKQLRAVEQISLLLISSRVDEINQIRRSEVEPGVGLSPEVIDVPVANDPKALYQVLAFEFQFVSSGEALRAFLNSLTKSDWFFAVRSMKIVGEAPSTERATSGGPATPTAPSAPKPSRLAVTMRIDLIEFPENQPAKPEPAKPAAPARPQSER